jgi:hypothetical protein
MSRNQRMVHMDGESRKARQSARHNTLFVRIGWSTSLVCCFAAVFAIGVNGQSRKPIPRDKIEWRADLESAHKDAVRTNKPMLIVFDSESCAFCRKMQDSTLSDQGLIWSINRSFIPVLLDTRKHIDIARKLEVKRVPATIALSPNADLLGGTIGFVDAHQFREMLYKVKKLNTRISK